MKEEPRERAEGRGNDGGKVMHKFVVRMTLLVPWTHAYGLRTAVLRALLELAAPAFQNTETAALIATILAQQNRAKKHIRRTVPTHRDQITLVRRDLESWPLLQFFRLANTERHLCCCLGIQIRVLGRHSRPLFSFQIQLHCSWSQLRRSQLRRSQHCKLQFVGIKPSSGFTVADKLTPVMCTICLDLPPTRELAVQLSRTQR